MSRFEHVYKVLILVSVNDGRIDMNYTVQEKRLVYIIGIRK